MSFDALNLVWIFVAASVVNNFTLAYFLGLCPFLGVSGRLDTALRLGLATIFVMLVTSMFASALNAWVLPHAPYLRIIAFIVVIASAVQLVETIMKKASPALFRALGIYLPLITTNCAILGLALFQTNREYNFLEGIIYALGAGAGFTIALVLIAGIREENDLGQIPRIMRGAAMSFLIAGILSLAFMGFAGLFSSAA